MGWRDKAAGSDGLSEHGLIEGAKAPALHSSPSMFNSRICSIDELLPERDLREVIGEQSPPIIVPRGANEPAEARSASPFPVRTSFFLWGGIWLIHFFFSAVYRRDLTFVLRQKTKVFPRLVLWASQIWLLWIPGGRFTEVISTACSVYMTEQESQMCDVDRCTKRYDTQKSPPPPENWELAEATWSLNPAGPQSCSETPSDEDVFGLPAAARARLRTDTTSQAERGKFNPWSAPAALHGKYPDC